MPVDFETAASSLAQLFAEIQPLVLAGTAPPIDSDAAQAFETIFRTDIQGYREALLGIVLVRLQDHTINLRLPYVNQGPTSYNGRDLDEQIVNPFLQTHRIPCSRGPYLAMFRRGFRFEIAWREGQRNKKAFDGLLALITKLENIQNDADVRSFAEYLLYKFAKLREASDVPLSRLQRISLEQYGSLITSLLNTPSGGRLPVILVVAAFRTIKDYFRLDWLIEYQGINVADSQTGVGGDITIKHEGRIVFAAEVTERPVERARVEATFNTKIAPHGIEDYLFFVRPEALADEARQQARQYFAQGHEVNFLEIENWVLMALATMGRHGRNLFNGHVLDLIGGPGVPRSLKVAWNEHIGALTSGS